MTTANKENTVVSTKYWETETPVEVKGTKSVAKVYVENGKIQAFPVVAGSRYGIGKGATLDLNSMDAESLIQLKEAVNKAIDLQMVRDVNLNG